MSNIKLGISITVGRVSSQEPRELRLSDFSTVSRQVFPPEGSSSTPGHSSDVFTFDDHAPLAFRHLREHFGVKADDYLVSICGESSLRELGTPGKSGAIFYLTEDGKFLIKTVSRKESKFLRQILPNYYNYVMHSEHTLLPRFFGLIRITTASHRRIRLVIFNNLLPDDVPIHQKFDLKGSTLGRYATEQERKDPNVTLKDLDLQEAFHLSSRHLNLVRSQIEADTAWLRSLLIMDYSLLLLVHFPERPNPWSQDGRDSELDMYSTGDERAESSGGRVSTGPLGYEQSGGSSSDLVHGEQGDKAGRSNGSGGKGGSSSGGGRCQAAGAGTMASDASPFRSSRASVDSISDAEQGDADEDDDCDVDADSSGGRRRGGPRLGRSTGGGSGTLHLPKLTDADLASAFRKARASTWTTRREYAIDSGLAATTSTGEPCFMYAGIIDILQVYGTRKKLEHQYKVFRYPAEKDGISVTNPASYAARMTTFLWSKFVDETLLPSPLETLPEGSLDEGAVRTPGGGGPVTLSNDGSFSMIKSVASPRRSDGRSTASLFVGVATPGEQPILAGLIEKKGASFPYSWGSRYCAVYASSCALVYYSSQQEAAEHVELPRGKKELRAINRYLSPSPPSDAAATALILDVTLTNGKAMLIRLQSIEERDRWFEALSELLRPPNQARSLSSGSVTYGSVDS